MQQCLDPHMSYLLRIRYSGYYMHCAFFLQGGYFIITQVILPPLLCFYKPSAHADRPWCRPIPDGSNHASFCLLPRPIPQCVECITRATVCHCVLLYSTVLCLCVTVLCGYAICVSDRCVPNARRWVCNSQKRPRDYQRLPTRFSRRRLW